MASTITSYTDEFILELVTAFLAKFRGDKRQLTLKLREAKIPKGTYSRLINYERSKFSIYKKTIETLRAYLENRPPKWSLVQPEQNFYCYSCEEIYPLAKGRKGDPWTCGKCKDIHNLASRARHLETYQEWRKGYYERRFGLNGKDRAVYLEKRKELYLNKTYGAYAECVKLTQQINQEIKNARRDPSNRPTK